MNERRKVLIVGGSEAHTTGRYLARSAAATGIDARYYDNAAALPNLDDVSLVLFVEPFGSRWPLEMQQWPCPVAAYLIDVHQGLQHRLPYLPFFDVVFVAQKDYCTTVASLCNVGVHWLPLACDPTLACERARSFEVGFVGQLGHRGSTRREVLEAVLSARITNDYRSYHTPLEMTAAYCASKIVINASVNGDLNMRVFEALNAGALLVTDRIANGMEECFTEGEHYVAYDSSDDAQKRIAYYLHHDQERQRIAKCGQDHARNAHTYDHRWAQLTRIVQELNAPYLAEIRRAGRERRLAAYATVYEGQRDPLAFLQLLKREGYRSAPSLCMPFARAVARKINARVPLTNGARQARRSRR